ncbi:branched-chain-amino-acid aminotransferase, cytosolic-like [Clavelina lepadiformis]|uniref:branched-chain-amino-acid aminotransferase, cytosolic-like n=1 Tax=Clavelina lepadiformis TaxID=159417 RepID=UPI0040413368
MATCGRLRLLDQCARISPFVVVQRFLNGGPSFKASEVEYRFTAHPKPKPANPDKCKFGKHFTDHMLAVEWDSKNGWGTPTIKPIENISLHPATSVFHYATELFEGMKAYRTEDNRIAMFRPMENMKRMERTARRACLPEFDKEELLKCIGELVRVDQEWVPYSNKASLYLRPTMIGTEPSLGVNMSKSALLYCILCPVGPYFETGSFNPVSLMADPRYLRAARGGSGAFKLGSNYGPTIRIQEEAARRGCQQVLWLHGEDHQITEVGTMNVFIYWINEDGDRELATMPLDKGIVLPGVTRMSIMDLAESWGEFKITERVLTMADLTKGLKEKRVLEMFGAGTACVICPIEHILYMDQDLFIPTMENGPEVAGRLYRELTDIQFGRVPHDWSHTVVEEAGNIDVIQM